MESRTRPASAITRRARVSPSRSFDELEGRRLLAGDAPSAGGMGSAVELIGPADQVASQVSPNAPLYYRIDPDAPGRLTAEAQAWGSLVRLTLLDDQGRVLVQSDGQAPRDPRPAIDQHVPAGTYYFEVESLAGSGVASLTVHLAPTSDPFGSIPLGPDATGVAASADFNGDGRLDLATPDGVHLGQGDGTFGPALAGTSLSDLPATPSALVAGDFNRDGKPDLAVADSGSSAVDLRLGLGDGTFAPPITIPVGTDPDALAVGDFNGDGRPDLAVADGVDGTVTILQGVGDGSFVVAGILSVGQDLTALVAGDFNGDGRTDLAVADYSLNAVTLLDGDGDGSFISGGVTSVGQNPTGLAAGDFDGDGRLDLAVADSALSNTATGTGDLRVLHNDGQGGFLTTALLTPGTVPQTVIAADVNGDHHLDLVAANYVSSTVAIALGDGEGHFSVTGSIPTGVGPDGVVPGDFNGDGRLDLAVADLDGQDLGVYLGNGDGSFRSPTSPLAGAGPAALATADFDGNGLADVAVADNSSDQVTVLLGSGDGTFRQSDVVAVGEAPIAIVAGDFNNDGVLDLAVADFGITGPGDLRILLGNGDGTFRSLAPLVVGSNPRGLAVGDFNGDGMLDLASTDAGSNQVSILMGRGDGTFHDAAEIPVGVKPRGIVAGDFLGNGRIDLGVADFGSNSVTILRGMGDGGFVRAQTVRVGLHPYEITAADLDGDGRLDLAVTEFGGLDADLDPTETGGNAVAILSGGRDGVFRVAGAYSVGQGPSDVIAQDFNGDGVPDLAVANAVSNSVSILLGNGNDSFRIGETLPVAPLPIGLAAADLDGDGHTDLMVALEDPSVVAVRLGQGDGQFVDPGPNPLTTRHTPVFADLSGDGAADVAVIDGTGQILFRQGRPGEPGGFDPPLVADPGSRSRDLVAVFTSRGMLLASVQDDSNSVVLLRYAGARFARVGTLITGDRPSRIVTADLNGDGIPDLLVLDHEGGTLSMFLGDGQGGFGPRIALEARSRSADLTGLADLSTADIDGDGRPDILVADRIAGGVDVLRNLGGGAFAKPVSYQAGAGPFGIGGLTGVSGVSSLEGTLAITSAVLTSGGLPDLVAVENGSNSLGRLASLGGGRFANPVASDMDAPAWDVRAADLNGDGLDEVVTLGASGLRVYRGDGRGGLVLSQTVTDIGDDPENLAIADVDGDGKPDVLIGSGFGDVLVLRPDASGQLQEPSPRDGVVTLAVAWQAGSAAQPVFALAVPGKGQVISEQGPGGVIVADRGSGLVTPTAVQLADLNGDGIPDLVVADGGANNVRIYLGLGQGRYSSALNDGHGFAVGTDPVGITVADVDGDGRPDLVIANQGSNDVSILLNRKVDGNLTLRPGPRLKVGTGPTATVVKDLYGNGKPDLVVSNSGSDNVYILKGRGFGSFNAVNPTILPVAGIAPVAVVLGNFTGRSGEVDLVTLDSGSNSLSFFGGINGGNPVAQSLPSGGEFPIAGLALDRGDGLSNLLVANNRDGTLAYFEGGPGGLNLATAFQPPELEHPTALALGADGQIFAGTEASEAAIRISLGLGLGGGGRLGSVLPGPSPSQDGGELVATGPAGAIALLQPPGESSLALVATLLSASTESVAGSANPGSPPNQSLLAANSDRSGDEDDADPAATPNPDQLPPAGASPLQRLVAGIDEAFARARDEARSAGKTRPSSRERALDDLLDRWAPTLWILGGPTPDQTRGLARAGLQALDAVLEAFGSDPKSSPPSRPMPSPSPSRVVPFGVASIALTALVRPLADRLRLSEKRTRGDFANSGRD